MVIGCEEQKKAYESYQTKCKKRKIVAHVKVEGAL